MRTKIQIILALITFSFSASASAACWSGGCDGVGAAAVEIVMPSENGYIYLDAPTDASNLNCTMHGGAYMVIHADNPAKKEIYATLLTGIALGKPLRIRIIEGSSDCKVTYVYMINS